MVQAALGLVDALGGVLDMFNEKPQASQRLLLLLLLQLLLLLLGSFNGDGALANQIGLLCSLGRRSGKG